MKDSKTKNGLRWACRILRKRGYSIGQIARRLRISESTVHWHVKDICLTAAQQQRLKVMKRALMAEVNARRRGKPLKPIMFHKPIWSRALVHLVAHLGFDGRIDRYGCHYYSRSYQQVQHVRQELRGLLGVIPKLRRRPNGIWIVSLYNVEVAAWLGRKEAELLSAVQQHPSWQRQWLQALFDDEGHVHLSGATRRVRASQDDRGVLKHAQKFLERIDISSRIDQRAHAVEITGRKNLVRFSQLISFSPGISINERRKNGLWTEPRETRELLDIALQSYQSPVAL